jgi:phosphoribosylamine--glycine ligase
MNVLILGSGGREHALAWKLAQSPLVQQLYIAPGNAGTALAGINAAINIDGFEAVADFVLTHQITMVVVGSEVPLVNGIRNYFDGREDLREVLLVGPSAEGARLEGSKDFAKQFMLRHRIPTAAYAAFGKGETTEACQYLRKLKPPYVLKVDGLAAGKGVVITEDYEEACQSLRQMLDENVFGEAGHRVVIEEFLKGIEVSVFVLTDGKNFVMLPEAKDYKRIGDGDTGKNTGGMGAVSPVPFAQGEFMQRVQQQIIQPTIEGLRIENIGYQGFIFFGLINVGGNPFVIEYNCRLGDPEAEVVIPRIKSDLAELLWALNDQSLHRHSLQVDERHAASVFLVCGGYPDAYEKGKKITGLEAVQGSLLFHAGTLRQGEDIVTSGGRVLAVTSLADTTAEALKLSYGNIDKIGFDKKYCRKDVGRDLLPYED